MIYDESVQNDAGKPLQTMIVAAGVVIAAGRVLLTQRKAGTHLEGAWEFPGGKADPGEDPKDAVVRELREELGIEVTTADILDVAFHRYEDAGRAVLLLFYLAKMNDDSPSPRAIDVADFKWSDASDLDPARFPPADRNVLEKVRRLL